MAARCLGLSIFLLWCFWAALDALMRVWELPKDKCTCLLVSCPVAAVCACSLVWAAQPS